MTSVYETERRVAIWLVQLHACGEERRVRALLDAGLLSALLSIISFRSTVDVGARNVAPHHERSGGRVLHVKVARQLEEYADYTVRKSLTAPSCLIGPRGLARLAWRCIELVNARTLKVTDSFFLLCWRYSYRCEFTHLNVPATLANPN